MTFLEITLKFPEKNRSAVVKVYTENKEPFLKQIKGAQSKELLIRNEGVQVLHAFASVADVEAYLESELYKKALTNALAPYLDAAPDIRIYDVV